MKRLYLLIILLTCIMGVFLYDPSRSVAAEERQYRVGVDDVLSINVLGHRDLNVLATVAVDGTIAFPNLGSVYVKDKTLMDIKEEITQKLSDGYIKYPDVTVSLIKAMSKKIFINGEVNVVGSVQHEKDMTIVRALSAAGGIRETGLYGKLRLRRKQKDGSGYKTIVNEEINNGIIVNRKIEDMELQPDDIMFVERNDTYLIQGEVIKRGRITLEKDMTVIRAILEAGGVTADGRFGKIRLRRKQAVKSGQYKDIGESKIIDGTIQNSEIEDLVLQPDDILIVERNQTYLIQGEVINRGRFMLEDNMTAISALLGAGGVTPDGRYGKMLIRRKEKGEHGLYKDIAESNIVNGVIENNAVEYTVLQPDDILIVEKNETYVVQGEIIQRGRFILEDGMTVNNVLAFAGGVTPDGRYGKIIVRRKQTGESAGYIDIAEAKINNGSIEDKKVGNIVIQPDDILMIERNKTVFVYGEVNRTGEFTLEGDMTVFKAITIAGGFTKWGSESKVKVLRPKGNAQEFLILKVNIGDILKGDASADITLNPGDTVVVSTGIF